MLHARIRPSNEAKTQLKTRQGQCHRAHYGCIRLLDFEAAARGSSPTCSCQVRQLHNLGVISANKPKPGLQPVTHNLFIALCNLGVISVNPTQMRLGLGHGTASANIN